MVLSKNFFVFTLATLAASCASSKSQVSDSTAVTVENRKVVAKPFRRVWDNYVRDLSKDFFVINNISKESRIINVSFSSNRPSQYVDCGRTSWSATHPTIGTRSGNYAIADSSVRFNVVGGALIRVNRRTRLSGRANIYLAPEHGGTAIRVNVKYILTINLRAVANTGQRDSRAEIVDFSTSMPSNVGEFTCRTKGTLERQLLGLAQ